ncbi:MAG: hypothetical protein NW208_11950 [Bryobacter sp.]|nr:hypothetical protein [Bryobacter sp.]
MDYQAKLTDFVERARKALGERLQAVVLYGSAATGEYDEGRSDLNLLLLASGLDLAELRSLRPLCEWWQEQGHSWPLLFTPEEYRSSADAFPMEQMDIAAAHRVLFGAFDFGPPQVTREVHRAQVEHEVRAKVLRLRQKGILLVEDSKELLRLVENSLSTFLVLLRHVLLLEGHAPPFARLELLQLAAGLGYETEALKTVLALRRGQVSPKSIDSVQLFESYLQQVQALAARVDLL